MLPRRSCRGAILVAYLLMIKRPIATHSFWWLDLRCIWLVAATFFATSLTSLLLYQASSAFARGKRVISKWQLAIGGCPKNPFWLRAWPLNAASFRGCDKIRADGQTESQRPICCFPIASCYCTSMARESMTLLPVASHALTTMECDPDPIENSLFTSVAV